MKLLNETKESLIYMTFILLAVAAFFLIFFGITGLRVFLGILFMAFPFYLILRKFNLEEGERIIFSILIGITIFPSLAYIFGFMASFRISIVLSFFVFLFAYFLLTKFPKLKF